MKGGYTTVDFGLDGSRPAYAFSRHDLTNAKCISSAHIAIQAKVNVVHWTSTLYW